MKKDNQEHQPQPELELCGSDSNLEDPTLESCCGCEDVEPEPEPYIRSEFRDFMVINMFLSNLETKKVKETLVCVSDNITVASQMYGNYDGKVGVEYFMLNFPFHGSWEAPEYSVEDQCYVLEGSQELFTVEIPMKLQIRLTRPGQVSYFSISRT